MSKEDAERTRRTATNTVANPPTVPISEDKKRNAARETVDILHEISTLLNTGLDRQSLSYCVSLIENGVNPEALAKFIRELRVENVQRHSDTASSED